MKYTVALMGGRTTTSSALRHCVALAGAVALFLALGGCSVGDDESAAATSTSAPNSAPIITAAATPTTDASPPSTPVTTVVVTTTEPEQTVEEEVLEAYLEAKDVVADALADPQNVDIDQLRSTRLEGPLEAVLAAVEDMVVAGEVLRFPEPSVASRSPRVVSLDGDVAVVEDCSVDDSFALNTLTDERRENDVASFVVVSEMVRESGVWKLGATVSNERTDGSDGCDDW